MARQYNLKEKQSLLDAALMVTGAAEGIVKLALKNELSITDELSAGTPLNLVEADNQSMFKYYKDNKIVPATDASFDDQLLVEKEGIDYWAIGYTFVVQ